MRRLLCFFGLHRWTDRQPVSLSLTAILGLPAEISLHEKAKCARCGYRGAWRNGERVL